MQAPVLCKILIYLVCLGHYSTVTITLEQEPDGAKLALAQLGVPESDYDRTKEGWRRHILESIKSTFGYGARLF